MISIRVKYRLSTVSGKEGVIYYQLIQNRITRQITTSYKLFPKEWDGEHSIINITKAEYHRRSYLQNIERHIMRDIANLQRVAAQNNDVQKTIDSYETLSKSCTIGEFARRVAQGLKKEGRTKTASSYLTALRSFTRFSKGADRGFDDIKPHLIKQYEQYLKARQVCNNTISFYMRILRAVYNRAVEENLTEQCFPFKGVYVGIDKTVKRSVDEYIISRLKGLELPKNEGLAFARDMFLFSLYCRGMAFVDVAHLTKSNIKGDYIVYQRHKTGQELNIRIEPCLKNIIARYSEEYDKGQYLLPILTGKNPNYESALRLQNLRLKNISEMMGLETPLTSYVARHSWATLAKRKGVSTQIISESMGHSNEKTTLIYLSSLDRSVIDQANAKLLSEI